MSRRLAAGAAGAALIATAVLAFALGKHPVVAGTNTAAPFEAAVRLPAGVTRCQVVSRVPRATHVRVVVDSARGLSRELRVAVVDRRGRIARGTRTRPPLGGVVVHLHQRTRPTHPAKLCFTNSGGGKIVLAGESKRVPRSSSAGGRSPVASVVFLRPGLSSWASRRDQIADRFANAQPGEHGERWLWVAVALAITAAGLAFWWAVFRLEPSMRKRPDPL